jgi:hypothetical protein
LGVFANKQKWATIFLAALMGSCCFAVGNAQTPISSSASAPLAIWANYYGAPERYLWITAVTQTNDKGYAVITGGASYQATYFKPTLYKINMDGALEWSKNTGLGSSAGLVQTSDNGYVIAGNTVSGPSYISSIGGVTLIKLGERGNLLWNKTITPVARVSSMVGTSDGGFVLAGSAHQPSYPKAPDQVSIVKTDSSGKAEWNNTYGDSGAFSNVVNIIQTSDQGYLFIGNIWTNVTTEKADQIALTKISSDGNVTWTKSYSTVEAANMSECYSVVQTSGGDYAFFGTTPKQDNRGNAIVIVDADSLGKLKWTNTFDNYGFADGFGRHCNPLAATSDGGLAFCGGRARIVKMDVFGNVEWNQTFEFRNQTVGILGWAGNCLIETMDGSLLLAGYGTTMNGQCYLVKVDAGLPPLPTPSPTATATAPVQTATIIAIAVFIAATTIVLLAYWIKTKTKK